MSRIRCICIDDKNRPKEVPANKWPKEQQLYHITYIYKQMKQPGVVQGVTLAEIDVSMCAPYNCFRLTRFAIHQDDLPALIELMKTCTEMTDVDINKLLEQVETREELLEKV